MLYLKRKFLLHRLMDGEGDDKSTGGGGAGPAGAGGDGGPGGTDGAGPGDGGKGSGDDPAVAWDSFKTKYAGDDPKKQAAIGRYANFEALADAQVALRDRFAKGEVKTTLPKNATEDQIKTWRQENGIPEAPEKYEILAPDGKAKASDEDIALMKPFLSKAHASHMSPSHVAVAVEGFREFIAERTAAMYAEDTKHKEEVVNKLTVDWGGDYQKNKTAIQGLLSTLPASVAKDIAAARLPDGRGLMNHPDMMKGLLAWAKEINPSGTIVPADGGTLAGGVEARLKEIRDVMKTDRKKYNGDPKMQQEYRDLLTQSEKAKGRK
jgi:hypothetical protein